MIDSKSGSGKVARFAAPRALGKFLSGVAAATFLIASVARAAWALPIIPLQVSTNPGNGDQNPYGVVFVPAGSFRTTQFSWATFWSPISMMRQTIRGKAQPL